MLTKELNNIDEYDILEEMPKRVKIGNRYVLIRQLTLHEYLWAVKKIMQFYLQYSSEFITMYKLYKEQEKENNKLKAVANQFIMLIKIEKFKKDLMLILNKLFPMVGRHLPFVPSYLERHATLNDILQLTFGLYQYNIADVKKNLTTLMSGMEMKQQTTVSSNLTQSVKENLAGDKARHIKPRYGKYKNTSVQFKTVTEA